MDVFDKMAQNITDVYNTPVAEYLREEFAKLQTALDAENQSEGQKAVEPVEVTESECQKENTAFRPRE